MKSNLPETQATEVHTAVAVVIVNYNTADMVIDCLKTIQTERKTVTNLQVFISDNASSDQSVQTLTQAVESNHWNDWVTILPLSKNGGFSYGNNACIRSAINHEKFDFIYLLNPDTLLHPGAICELLDFMLSHPNAGIIGGAMVGADGQPQESARRFPTPLSELNEGARFGLITRLLKNRVVQMPIQSEAHQCDWVSGASLMIRREVIERIGLMDEGYFLYYEELDYCKRALNEGFEVWYVPASVITHLEGVATGVHQRKRRGKYWYDSRRRFFVKSYTVFGLIAADILWATGRLTFNVRRMLRLGKNFESIQRDPTWYAWDLLLGDLIAVITGEVFRNKHNIGGTV